MRSGRADSHLVRDDGEAVAFGNNDVPALQAGTRYVGTQVAALDWSPC